VLKSLQGFPTTYFPPTLRRRSYRQTSATVDAGNCHWNYHMSWDRDSGTLSQCPSPGLVSVLCSLLSTLNSLLSSVHGQYAEPNYIHTTMYFHYLRYIAPRGDGRPSDPSCTSFCASTPHPLTPSLPVEIDALMHTSLAIDGDGLRAPPPSASTPHLRLCRKVVVVVVVVSG